MPTNAACSFLRRRTAAFVAIAAVAFATGCSRGPDPDRPPNILFLLIDTLRADALGYDGDERSRSPFLATLADRGNVFSRAYSPSSWTCPSIASYFTAQYPSQHRIAAASSRIPESATTLAEVLKEHGYATAGWTANPIIGPKLGYGQGFDTYRVIKPPAAAPAANAAPAAAQEKPAPAHSTKARAESLHATALEWLDGHQASQAPFFLYLHYLDTHYPLDPPQWARERVEASAPPKAPAEAQPTDPEQAMSEAFHLAYKAEVLALDEALRLFFVELDRRGALDNTIVVVVADHGEEFREHGRYGHGKTLFEEVQHIPLLVLLPGQSSRVTSSAPRSAVELPTTLLELAGLPVPPTFERASFLAQLGDGWRRRAERALGGMAGSNDAPGIAYTELLQKDPGGPLPKHFRSVVRQDSKLIEEKDGKLQLFDLKADPRELRPLPAPPDARGELEAITSAYANRAAGPKQAEAVPLDPETQERLRALGYVD